MKTIVVIPTYDEKDNVTPMSEAVLKHDVEILFVDDNSPDGTGAVIDGLVARNPRIHVLHREKKAGLGRAYVAGFAEALKLGAELIIQMDCDFSHDPNDIPRLISAMGDGIQVTGDTMDVEFHDNNTGSPVACRQSPGLVIGSRYVLGGSTPGWPFKRRLISRCGGIFIRTVTGMPLMDPTGGFKCWKAETLRKIDFETVASAGYSFQLEMNHRTWKAGCAIKEIPITFTDRVAGYSKITPGIATESIKIALKLRFGK